MEIGYGSDARVIFEKQKTIALMATQIWCTKYSKEDDCALESDLCVAIAMDIFEDTELMLPIISEVEHGRTLAK